MLATNHVDDDGDFKPTASAMHLVNGQDFGQYGQKLYGDEEGDLDDGPEPVVCPPCSRDKDGNEEDENEREKKRFSICGDCGKSCKFPNALMIKKLDDQITWLKANKDRVPPNIIRDRCLLSGNLEDYCTVDILFWFPNRVMKRSFPGRQLTCWNGTNCSAPSSTSTSRRKPKNSEIQEQKIRFRFVEGTDGNAFVVYPEYYCPLCESAKAATDTSALPKMNIPVVLIYRAPVVFTHASAMTKELFELIIDAIRRHLAEDAHTRDQHSSSHSVQSLVAGYHYFVLGSARLPPSRCDL